MGSLAVQQYPINGDVTKNVIGNLVSVMSLHIEGWDNNDNFEINFQNSRDGEPLSILIEKHVCDIYLCAWVSKSMVSVCAIVWYLFLWMHDL